MSDAVYPVSGSKLYIGKRVAPKGRVTAANFLNAPWVEVDGWVNAGALGDTQGVGEQDMINQKRVRKFKTTLNAGTMENQFVPMANDPGQKLMKKAIEDCQPYQFKVEWGADCAPMEDVEISVAAPAVVDWPDNTLEANDPVTFTTTGTLPAPLQVDVVYFVVESADGAFSIAATEGGPAIETTSAGSGVHTATAPPVGMTDMFYGLVTGGSRSGGTATSAHLRTTSIAVDSNIVEI